MSELINIKGVDFEKSDEWKLTLPARSLLTPVYFRSRIKHILVTNGETGKATIHECGKRCKEIVFHNKYIRVHKLPQGVTYELIDKSSVQILFSSIAINKRE